MNTKVGFVLGALALVILTFPALGLARSRTGSDLGTRIATLETQVGSLNTLLENVSRVGDDLFIASGLNVSGSGGLGPNGQHVACFQNTDGGTDDGISIQIDRAQCYSANNFTTFYNDDDYVCGRVEAFSIIEGDPAATFPAVPSIGIDDFFEFCPAFVTFSGGSLPSISGGSLPSFSCDPFPDCGFTGGSWPTVSLGSLPSVDFKSPLTLTNPLDAGGAIATWLADVICWAFENDFQTLIQTDPFGLALAPLILTEATLCKFGTTAEGGVTYGSTGADYAEWLEKLNPGEPMLPGQVVGVFGGKVTKRTEGADQVMALSLAPIVAGNIPPAGQESRYAQVGFMGQVPVYVRGKVAAGDYILPSGRNDGVGIAITPQDLQVEHLPQILGRAWSSSDTPGLAPITVAIGVKTSAAVEICTRQAKQIAEIREAIEALQERRSAVPRAGPPVASDHDARIDMEGGAR